MEPLSAESATVDELVEACINAFGQSAAKKKKKIYLFLFLTNHMQEGFKMHNFCSLFLQMTQGN